MKVLFCLAKHDKATEYGHAYFTHYVVPVAKRVYGEENVIVVENCSREKFEQLLTSEPIVYITGVGHGNEKAWSNYHDSTCHWEIILDEKNCYLLRDRWLSHLACLTGKELLKKCVEVGAINTAGYKVTFVFFIKPNAPNPLADPIARDFLYPDMLRHIKRLEGYKPSDADRFAYNEFTRNAEKWKEVNPQISAWLLHDRDGMVTYGQDVPLPQPKKRIKGIFKNVKFFFHVERATRGEVTLSVVVSGEYVTEKGEPVSDVGIIVIVNGSRAISKTDDRGRFRVCVSYTTPPISHTILVTLTANITKKDDVYVVPEKFEKTFTIRFNDIKIHEFLVERVGYTIHDVKLRVKVSGELVPSSSTLLYFFINGEEVHKCSTSSDGAFTTTFTLTVPNRDAEYVLVIVGEPNMCEETVNVWFTSRVFKVEKVKVKVKVIYDLDVTLGSYVFMLPPKQYAGFKGSVRIYDEFGNNVTKYFDIHVEYFNTYLKRWENAYWELVNGEYAIEVKPVILIPAIRLRKTHVTTVKIRFRAKIDTVEEPQPITIDLYAEPNIGNLLSNPILLATLIALLILFYIFS